MQMSDFLSQLPHSKTVSSSGFSLLEMLTVLFIIGTAAALVTPNLPIMLDRISFATERDSLIREINGLPYRALEKNQDLVLAEEFMVKTGASSRADTRDRDIRLGDIKVQTSHRFSALDAVEVDLPEGWRLTIPDPIFYRASGFCSGGALRLIVGSLRYDFDLLPPYCQIREQGL